METTFALNSIRLVEGLLLGTFIAMAHKSRRWLGKWLAALVEFIFEVKSKSF